MWVKRQFTEANQHTSPLVSVRLLALLLETNLLRIVYCLDFKTLSGWLGSLVRHLGAIQLAVPWKQTQLLLLV